MFKVGDLVETIIGKHLGTVISFNKDLDYYNVYIFEFDKTVFLRWNRLKNLSN